MKRSFADMHRIVPEPNSTRLLDSDLSRWTSLYAAAFLHDGRTESFESIVTARVKLVVITSGRLKLGIRSKGKWVMGARGTGSAGLTPAGEADTLMWHSIDGPFKTAHVYLPKSVFLKAADEYRRAGMQSRTEPLNATGLWDPLILQMTRSIVAAAGAGAPDFYAESASQLLALHLLRIQKKLPAAADDLRSPGNLSQRRIENVKAYMLARYNQAISLDDLAREAGVSRYHFSHLFRSKVGISPHRFLSSVRLEAAASMLRDTDKPIFDVALECGYYATAHFSEAFRKDYGQTPTAYRLSNRRY